MDRRALEAATWGVLLAAAVALTPPSLLPEAAKGLRVTLAAAAVEGALGLLVCLLVYAEGRRGRRALPPSQRAALATAALLSLSLVSLGLSGVGGPLGEALGLLSVALALASAAPALRLATRRGRRAPPRLLL